MKQSPLFQLNWNDIIKGLIMAALAPAVVIIEQTLDTGSLTFNWPLIAKTAIAGGVAYIIKNFLTPADPIKEITKTDDGTVTKTVVKTDSVDVNVTTDEAK
jgi:hypothetical protein